MNRKKPKLQPISTLRCLRKRNPTPCPTRLQVNNNEMWPFTEDSSSSGRRVSLRLISYAYHRAGSKSIEYRSFLGSLSSFHCSVVIVPGSGCHRLLETPLFA